MSQMWEKVSCASQNSFFFRAILLQSSIFSQNPLGAASACSQQEEGPLGVSTIIDVFCGGPLQTSRGFLPDPHAARVRVWLRYTGPVGISWENKPPLITDQTHIPSRAALRDKAVQPFSHAAMELSVRVWARPAEALCWRHFTETPLLWYVSGVTARLRASARESKTKTYFSARLHSSVGFSPGLVLIMWGMDFWRCRAQVPAELGMRGCAGAHAASMLRRPGRARLDVECRLPSRLCCLSLQPGMIDGAGNAPRKGVSTCVARRGRWWALTWQQLNVQIFD